MTAGPTGARAATFPKEARVRKRAEFLAIQSSGKRLPTRSFLLVHRPAEAAVARLGITVTKKIGKAVVRNRIKRAVREAFRRARAELPRLDVVVIARQGAETLRPNEVAAELAPAFDRLARGVAR